ncbi:MAG: ABC transporter [Ideonella sp. MAG2]|nr:MAG: ABC transporter [Ideonella sp. MAG2]
MLAWTGLSVAWSTQTPPILFADFQAPQGARVVVCGPSGCGKSTLLAVLSGLLTPQAGEVRVGDTQPLRLSAAQRDTWRGQHIGLVPQRLHLAQALTVRENLALPFVAAGLPVDEALLGQRLQQLGLASLAARKPHELSVGQAQRVAIARAVMRAPRLLLADEPTAHLDETHADAALRLLDEAAAVVGATVLMATHDQRLLNRWPAAQCLRLPALAGLEVA